MRGDETLTRRPARSSHEYDAICDSVDAKHSSDRWLFQHCSLCLLLWNFSSRVSLHEICPRDFVRLRIERGIDLAQAMLFR